MADRRTGDVLRHSVLDRLSRSPGPSADLRIGVQELRVAVLRDLEALLNTRRPLLSDLSELPEAESSLLTYGIPDVSQFSSSASGDVHTLAALITNALRTFEPRLMPDTIRVRPVETKHEGSPRLHFKIEAILHVEPVREPIVFDTEVDMERGDVDITVTD